jgi:hypothetical protein
MTSQNLYQKDFYAWCYAQANCIRSGEKIDMEHIAEELELMGGNQSDQLINRFSVLFMHLLKLIYQPSKKKKGWINSVGEQRDRIELLIEDNPSLKGRLSDWVSKGYRLARKDASRETGLPLKTFPEQMPFTLEQALNEDWMP